MTEDDKFKALVLIDFWQEKFPVAFPEKPAPKVPLRINIGQAGGLLYKTSIAVGAAAKDVANALYLWCRGKRYWQSFKTNEYRFGLYGKAAQRVTAEDVAYAKHKLKTWIFEEGGVA